MLPLQPDHNPDQADALINRDKVERDIAFLLDRLAAMKLQPKPNTQLIAHYETMLKSRQAVLNWLLDGHDNHDLPRHNQG
ncbi:hypothetical protein [Cellvibrio japonicus]|uniref:Uncharacterized protein n=1 Tax=Cellvibrio japonicus (strain Ueda107) TaxID=498211 RepID=B3PJ12_CELJU|nr:hypothetical protein [Cellvibrio japonicus]ACE84222.1 hypothetical protein CJA_0523 [Cellvibrio japonicus Ueda107]QEI11214.1 hypothetical protein FY117_02510 [Cellvibrio japonicus]QEI14788.1 hypothetical protein FY116_02510 [Cellvibrio japonicus]QEI18368.1 hypothetical protein FY115_02510 [Cellvibrio japonicus]